WRSARSTSDRAPRSSFPRTPATRSITPSPAVAPRRFSPTPTPRRSGRPPRMWRAASRAARAPSSSSIPSASPWTSTSSSRSAFPSWRTAPRRSAAAGCRPPGDTGERHVFHRFVVTVERPLGPVLDRLTRGGIAARRPVFRPIHRALGVGGYPEADRLWTHCLSLPCYPSLTDAEVDAVGTALAEALRG